MSLSKAFTAAIRLRRRLVSLVSHENEYCIWWPVYAVTTSLFVVILSTYRALVILSLTISFVHLHTVYNFTYMNLGGSKSAIKKQAQTVVPA